MKVFKKIAVAVSMVAMCCTILVPGTVNAASDTCIHNYVKEKNYSHYQVVGPWYREHSYTSGFYTEDDGTQIPIIKTCRVDLVFCYYDMKCANCGDVEEDAAMTEKELHKNCVLKDQGLMDK